MPFYERGDVRIHYQERGSGFPLFVIYGGGLESILSFSKGPFDAVEEFHHEYRCITMDLRNANRGQSIGPLDPENPWDMHTDDQLALLDHLGVDKFFVLGFCIGNPLIWNMLRRVPDRIVAAVSAQPSGIDPANPEVFYKRNLAHWGSTLCSRRPEITMETVDKFLTKMYKGADFVITASRDFVSKCQTPLLVMPDDTESHPYRTAMEMVNLAPNVQVSLFPWKNTKENTALAVRHLRTFLKANRFIPGSEESNLKTLSAADRLEIQELVARFIFTEDFGQVDAWVDTFTKDGSFTGLRKGNSVTGHDQLREFALKRLERPGVLDYVHLGSNLMIAPTAQGAQTKSYSMMVETKLDGSLVIRGMAIKTDELRREDGRWKFKSRINAPWPEVDAIQTQDHK